MLADYGWLSPVCVRCRELHLRCSGRPLCSKCTKDGVSCRFVQSRRGQKATKPQLQPTFATTTTLTSDLASVRPLAGSSPSTTTCENCRKRHLKCTGGVTCRRCAGEGLSCSYKPSRRGIRRVEEPHNHLELTAQAEPDSWVVQLSATAHDDPTASRSFCFFRRRTSHDLHGRSDQHFWISSILQLSDTQPAVKHMLTALGALHETLERAYWVRHAGETQSLHIVSLQQYNQAISLLKREPHNLPVVVLLVTCVLFVCFETLQQDYESAFRSLNSGMGILGRRDVSKVQSGSIEDEVVRVFLRLRLQASTYIATAAEKSRQASAGNVEKRWVTGPYPSIPESFSSLQHAKTTFNRIHDQAYSVMDSITGVPDYPLIRKLHGRFDDQLVTWHTKLEEFLHKGIGMHIQEDAIIMQIQYRISRILAQGVTHNDEMHFDNHVRTIGI